MIRYITYVLSFILFINFSYADIRVVPVMPTPQPNNAKIEILYPEKFEIKNSLPVKMQVRVTNYALGDNSNFPRKEEIYNWDIGQSVRVVIDNKPFFAKITNQIDPFNDEGIYFQKLIEFYLPGKLEEGTHSIRAYLVRSYGECLKNKGSFDSEYFYYKDKDKMRNVNLKAPYLTYNEPAFNQTFDDKKPVLLDFYINNCELSRGGFKVKLVIDNKLIRYLDKWTPYYIYGLRKGAHSIELTLVDSDKNTVPGEFNKVKAQISIK